MIASGEKKEEYRDEKEFWVKRLFVNHSEYFQLKKNKKGSSMFTHVKFARGGHFHPSILQMVIELKGYEYRTGNPDWGAEPGKEYLVIKLGQILKQ